MTTRPPDPLARPDPLASRAARRVGRVARDIRLLTAVVVAGLMAIGAGIRWWALGGLEFALGSDDARYVAAAKNLANGFLPDGEAEWFGARAAFLWPVALVFRLAGADDYRAIAWPLACSVLCILATFLVARELVGRRPALVAAGIVAVAPVEVLWATRLRPDAVMPLFIALAAWAALRASRAARSDGNSHIVLWLGAAGLAMGAAWSARETALVMIPVVALAAWPALRAAWARAWAFVAGLAIIPLALVIVFAFDGRPLWPLTATAGAGSFRSPADGWGATTAYLAQMVEAAVDPRSPLFLALPLLLVAGAAAISRRCRTTILPAAWLIWGFLYLEVGTLLSVDKPVRFLTLLTVPAALLIAVALDGRLSPLLIPAVAVATLLCVRPRIDAGNRGTSVVLVSAVAGALRDLPPGPVLTADYTWWAKLNAYLARDRVAIRRDIDPAFLDEPARERARELDPLPDPADYRGGYVVTGPVRRTAGWPSNWDAAEREIARAVATADLRAVARVGRATIWRWVPWAVAYRAAR
ncbi:MAG: glycosyltransferase family 39 protein [Actinobacteria bacterium]|nr:glycosyltransferase family 39 protein [Actinomycetota bacterium]